MRSRKWLRDYPCRDSEGRRVTCRRIQRIIYDIEASGIGSNRGIAKEMNRWGTDPFYVAIKFTVQMNKIAAGLSGLSALCVGAKLLT